MKICYARAAGIALAVAVAVAGFLCDRETVPVPPMSFPVATATSRVESMYAYFNDADASLKETAYVVKGRISSWRYGTLPSYDDPLSGRPVSARTMTATTVEVSDVLMGELPTGEKAIEICQMGGVTDNWLWVHEPAPYLPDFAGQEVVLLLRSWDFEVVRPPLYRLSSEFQSVWLVYGDTVSLALSRSEVEKSGGSPDYFFVSWVPLGLGGQTVDELKKAIEAIG